MLRDPLVEILPFHVPSIFKLLASAEGLSDITLFAWYLTTYGGHCACNRGVNFELTPESQLTKFERMMCAEPSSHVANAVRKSNPTADTILVKQARSEILS